MPIKVRVVSLAVASALAAALSVIAPTIAWPLRILSFACAAVALLDGTASIHRRLWQIEEKIRVSRDSSVALLASELHSMHVILDRFPECTMPTTGWSMRFSNLHAIVDLLDQYRPTCVVEFGSGMSTLCVASWMKQQQRGRIVSFDHDPQWARLTQRYLERHGLTEFSLVHVANLLGDDDSNTTGWYDITSREDSLGNVDILIVDGPPAGNNDRRLARQPALRRMYKHLSPSAVVLLDDAHRPGEKRVVENWLKEFPEFHLRIVGGITGLAVLTRNCPSETESDTVQSPICLGSA